MAKKETTEQEQALSEATTSEQPTDVAAMPAAPVPETQLLTAETRDDLFQKVEKQKASLTGEQTLIAGAVARRDDDQYIIQTNII